MDFRIEMRGPSLDSRGSYGAGETRCRGVPERKALESCYACASVGVVVSGHFDYRSPIGTLTAVPGTILLGNFHEEFAYRYRDTSSVRRAVVAFGAGLLEEIADSCGSDPRFATAALSPSRRTIHLYGAIRRLAAVEAPLEETVFEVAAAALATGGNRPPGIGAGQRRHVLDVARYLDRAYAKPITLDAMAAMAQLSRFHFIRAFRAVTGENPRQYLIAARLRAAADRLLDTHEPVTSIALNVGFNDLSHFNATFRRTFGMAPCAWRGYGVPLN